MLNVPCMYTLFCDQIREAFNHFDKNGSGELEAPELQPALKRLGLETTREEALQILRGTAGSE